jgi:hypothetical protein
MQISNLIKRLQYIQENKGDLTVYISDNSTLLNDVVVGGNNTKIAILV